MPPTETPDRPRHPKRRSSRKRKKPASRSPAAAPAPDVPHWLTADSRWDNLPENVREVVPKLLAPAYRRFVLDAPGELERSVGLTLVHLLWLELCDQSRMAMAIADPTGVEAILQDPDQMIEKHLRLATVKCQTAELLMRLRVVNEALSRPTAAPLPHLPRQLRPSRSIYKAGSTLNPRPRASNWKISLLLTNSTTRPCD